MALPEPISSRELVAVGCIEMKKFLIALTLLALSPQLATAQEAQTAVGAEKVTYSRAAPKALRAFVPRGGKSRFWGATNLKHNGQKVWVHVYDVEKLRYLETEFNGGKTQKSGLDLFVFSPSLQLKRISSIRFGYRRYGDYERGVNFETIGVQSFWLNPKTKQTPIVQIEINDPQGYYGTSTEYVFAVLSQNLKETIVQHRAQSRIFGNGSSTSGGWRTTFGTDENGLLTIVYNESSSSGNFKTIYKWTGSYFKPFEKKFKELSEGAEFKTVPLNSKLPP